MATLVRWEPFRELASLQNEMSRFMNGLAEGNGRTSQSWVPTADVWETEDEVVYAFDLPGIPEDKISVELEDGALTSRPSASASRRSKRAATSAFERRFGTFSRTIGLPQGVTENDVKATFEHGVLEVHVAKPEQAKPQKIQSPSAARRRRSRARPAEVAGRVPDTAAASAPGSATPRQRLADRSRPSSSSVAPVTSCRISSAVGL